MQDENLPNWVPRLAPHGGPRFLQIADALQAAVAGGSLKPGDRLPPQRQLAAQLDVDLTTITRAYDEARRRNLLEGRGARGTYVAAPKVELTSILDLSMNTPPPPDGVDFDDMLKQGLSQVLMSADNHLLMTYHLGGGSDSERRAGAKWLEPMFGHLDPRQLVVCPGAQAAIGALILALTEPGDAILAEPMSYPGLRAAASQFGRELIAVEADKHGIVPEMLEEACRQHKPGLVYLNPTLQNPTAVTIPERRRKELASVAKRCNVRIVEDDPYWLLADAPPPPIATFAPEQVHYISTLSKCLTPGLRVAFVLLRDPQERERFLAALRSFALMAAPLGAALATQWIFDGSADGLMEGVRKEARLRHRMAQDVLAGRYGGTGDGLHVWLELPAYWNSSQLARVAESEGIAVTPAEAFATGGGSVNAIRISLGNIKDRRRLQAGLQRLSHLLARRPESFSAAVV
jgi:DNA-binding transcriptional MocR family regulator